MSFSELRNIIGSLTQAKFFFEKPNGIIYCWIITIMPIVRLALHTKIFIFHLSMQFKIREELAIGNRKHEHRWLVNKKRWIIAVEFIMCR